MSQDVKRTIILAANYYGRDLKPEVVAMMADDLSDLDPRAVVAAFDKYRRETKVHRFPLPAEIRQMVQPSVDPDSAAREIAARICGAVPKFGWARGQDAREYIGEVGWEIVQRQGGWSYICENLGLTLNPSAFQAQVRDQAKSLLSFGAGSMAQAIGLKAGDSKQGLVSAGEIIAGLLPSPKTEGA